MTSAPSAAIFATAKAIEAFKARPGLAAARKLLAASSLHPDVVAANDGVSPDPEAVSIWDRDERPRMIAHLMGLTFPQTYFLLRRWGLLSADSLCMGLDDDGIHGWYLPRVGKKREWHAAYGIGWSPCGRGYEFEDLSNEPGEDVCTSCRRHADDMTRWPILLVKLKGRPAGRVAL